MFENNIGGTERYWTFPNNYCIVTVNFQSSVILSENRISILPSKEQNIHASTVHRYNHPIEVYYENPIHEITIYFKPLGIGHFVSDPEIMFKQNKMTEFTPPHLDFGSCYEKIFAIKNRELQRETLEEYWLSKLIAKDLTLVEGILTEIESGDKIADIAKKHNISRKHLNKMILKNLGKSPTEYRKIYRFRSAINNRELKKLTELTYENLFYDQSHFIKDFKALTNINPKTFFKKVNTNDSNVWLFI
jgi:AraC-like DNA-binding protein